MKQSFIYRFALAGMFCLLAVIPYHLFAQQNSNSTTGIRWNSLKNAQEMVRDSDKKVLIYSRAEWCHYCKKMENEVFSRKEIRETMQEYFYPVMIDIESDSSITFNGKEMTESEFAREFQVVATPTMFFVDSKGDMLGRQPGYIPPEIFKKLLSYLGTGAYNEMKFKEYLENQK